jgi:hypothetical protein
VEDGAGQLARDLVHIGDHQQQALRGGEGGGQRAGLQRAVHGSAAPPSDCISTPAGRYPKGFSYPFADHSSANSPIPEDGVIG